MRIILRLIIENHTKVNHIQLAIILRLTARDSSTQYAYMGAVDDIELSLYIGWHGDEWFRVALEAGGVPKPYPTFGTTSFVQSCQRSTARFKL